MILVEDLTSCESCEIAPAVFEMVLKGEMVTDMQVGQSVHLKVPDPSKPFVVRISISEVDYGQERGNHCLSCGA